MKPRILVTGGTGALGRAIVAALRAHHYRVTANYWHDEKRALAVANATGCDLARADVRDENAVQALFNQFQFDAIVHAAGTNRDALLPRTSPALWRAQMDWLDAAFLVTRAALRFLPADGRLMLISSRVGERGFAGQSAYATSKGAMIGLMRAAAAERDDLKINAICPGFAPSDLSADLSEKIVQQRAAQNLLPVADAAHSLAATCVYLMRASLNGQIVRPDCRI